jgi:hypothetical protein
MRTFIDISVPPRSRIASDPPAIRPEIGYCHIEKPHNLEALPADGFQVSCFPTEIHAASAGRTRAVAIIDQPEETL